MKEPIQSSSAALVAVGLTAATSSADARPLAYVRLPASAVASALFTPLKNAASPGVSDWRLSTYFVVDAGFATTNLPTSLIPVGTGMLSGSQAIIATPLFPPPVQSPGVVGAGPELPTSLLPAARRDEGCDHADISGVFGEAGWHSMAQAIDAAFAVLTDGGAPQADRMEEMLTTIAAR
jgi:hypothetical protein